jgi:hypothetical protein
MTYEHASLSGYEEMGCSKQDWLPLSFYTSHAEDMRQASNLGYYMDTFKVYFKVPYLLQFPSLFKLLYLYSTLPVLP